MKFTLRLGTDSANTVDRDSENENDKRRNAYSYFSSILLKVKSVTHGHGQEGVEWCWLGRGGGEAQLAQHAGTKSRCRRGVAFERSLR